jgi:cellobiose transport system substrate-binding protein
MTRARMLSSVVRPGLAPGGFPRALAVFVALLAGLTGCAAPSAGTGGATTTITIATFGDFGYQPLFAEYERQHPDIRLVQQVSEFDVHNQQLETELAAGSGAADIEAIEDQVMPQFLQYADKFVDLAGLGAAGLRSRYPEWKWAEGVADGGKDIVGLGTDMGGLAMCYQPALFAEAGLPTSPAQVAGLWPTWEDYEKVADEFSAKVHNAKFADSAGGIYNAILDQAPDNFFAPGTNALIAGSNPDLRRAFDIAGTIGAAGETAKVDEYTQAWNVAIKQGTFATIECPAWMLPEIQSAGGPANSGKWDVTTVPGQGGNQGGSFLAIPKQSPHQQEAYAVASWLTAPAQEKRIFLDCGDLPSEPAAYDDPQVIDKVSPYFSDAPVGRIYASSANTLRPTYDGPKDSVVRPIFGQALERVEDGSQSLNAAWNQSVQQARAAVE